MTATYHPSIAQVRVEERGFAAAVHFPLAIVPLWSFIFLLAMWVYFKERSREVVFHVQQALFFAVVQHIGILCWIVFEVLLRVVELVNAQAAALISELNTSVVLVFLGVHALFSIYAAVSVYLGKAYLYPVLGRRVLEGALSKFTSGG